MARFVLPKPKKLPSGNFRVQFQIDGKRYSVTGSSSTEAKEKADKKAREVLYGIEQEKKTPLTVDKAIENYILSKKGTLSPSTVRGYEACRRNYLQSIMKTNLNDLTQSDIQKAVGEDFINGKSPKTIRNAHGLLASVLDIYRPNFVLHTRLPQKEKFEIRIFSEEEMKKVWKAAKGSDYELPILLASWMGLRMSEIRGIKYGDICKGLLHVHRAVVRDENGKHVEKGPKTTAGDRWVKLPETIHEMICDRYVDIYGEQTEKGLDDYICPWADITIYKNFVSICEKAGVEPCRFHDLRHFAASEAHAIGVPDKYSMRRMGHKTDNMLKTVYQHLISEKESVFADLIDEKMEELYKSAHENAHENEIDQ